jgi:hypothetical protein
MIRTRRLTQALLDAWLVDQRLNGHHARYRLRLWQENRAALPAVLTELRLYADEALDDARRRLRRGFQDPLSPFADPLADPAANYPTLLHRVTLQGYFGETLAGIAVEHWGALGHTDWHVPAFLFRMHDQEFQHLERINQRLRDGEVHEPDETAQLRVGRTGDDVLAFRMNGERAITDVMTLEAKCLSRSNNTKIEEAHRKLSAGGPLPPGVRELVNLLAEYGTPEANAWLDALVRLRQEGYRAVGRHDGVTYATAAPARNGARAWMPRDQPHAAYTATRYLEGMEFHFENLEQLINSLYRGAAHADP